MTHNPLLTTKLFSPAVRPERVERERLLARLDGLLRPGPARSDRTRLRP